MPHAFLSPQLWGEDAVLLSQAHNVGWHSIFEPLGGTLVIYGRIIAIATGGLPLAILPSVYFLAALAAVLLVVFLATSPRFEIPYWAVAALAIVIVPPGEEVLCALANTQWVLPLGLIILLFSRPNGSRTIITLEAIYVFIVGATGPVGVFALPLFLARTWMSRGLERERLRLLSAALLVTSLIQIATILFNLRVLNLIEPRDYSFTLWLSIPLNWLEPFPRIGNTIGYGVLGVIIAVGIAVTVGFDSLRMPYRFQKIAMIFFAGAILYSGMLKYRADLGTGYGFTPRYVYTGSVFFIWFLCIAFSTAQRSRDLFACVLFIVFINCFIVTVLRERPRSLDWPEAMRLMKDGETTIPISPPGWFLRVGTDPWTTVVKARDQ
jgi:hypothetical protein